MNMDYDLAEIYSELYNSNKSINDYMEDYQYCSREDIEYTLKDTGLIVGYRYELFINLAKNNNISSEQLLKLVDITNDYCYSCDGKNKVYKEIVKNRFTNGLVIKRILEKWVTDTKVLEEILKNVHVDSEILGILVNQRCYADSYLTLTVVKHPSITTHIFLKLLKCVRLKQNTGMSLTVLRAIRESKYASNKIKLYAKKRINKFTCVEKGHVMV